MSINYTSSIDLGTESCVSFPQNRWVQQDKVAVKKLIDYLKEAYAIEVPSDFDKQLLETHATVSMARFGIDKKVVDSIVEACRSWLHCLENPEDLYPLICHELLSMVQCHASVLSNYFIEKAGFKLRNNKPAYSYALIINSFGNVAEVR